MKITNFFKVAVFSLSLPLIACNEKIEENTEATPTASVEVDQNAIETTANVDVQDAIETSASQGLAELTVEGAKIGLTMLAGPNITEKQQSCVNKVDFTDLIPDIKSNFENAFTPEQLDEIFDIYNDPDVKAMIDDGVQAAIQSLTSDIEPQIETPAGVDEGMEKMRSFMKTELGQNLANFEEFDQSIFDVKIKECDLNLEDQPLNEQPTVYLIDEEGELLNDKPEDIIVDDTKSE